MHSLRHIRHIRQKCPLCPLPLLNNIYSLRSASLKFTAIPGRYFATTAHNRNSAESGKELSIDDLLKVGNEGQKRSSIPEMYRENEVVDVNQQVRDSGLASGRLVTMDEEGGLERSERLQKYLARMGICSRRQAEKFILEGRVQVDDSVVFELGFRIVPGVHRVTFDGVEISAPELQEKINRPKLYAFRKVRGMLCSRTDSKGRPTLYEALARLGLGHLMPVSRLDFNSEGLLLLTNDGTLKQYLEHPSSKIEREYMVRVRSPVEPKDLAKLRKLQSMTNRDARVTGAEITSVKGANTWLRVTMVESGDLGIRDAMDKAHLFVSRIVRTRYGPFKLTDRIPKRCAMGVEIPDSMKEKCNVFFQESLERMEKEKTAMLLEEAARCEREEMMESAGKSSQRRGGRQKPRRI